MANEDWKSLPHDKLLELLRRKHKVTRGLGTKVALALGIQRSAVSQMLKGTIKIPKERFLKFIEASGISEDDVKLLDVNFIEIVKTPPRPKEVPLVNRPITKRDLQWLMSTCSRLKQPVSLGVVIGLLKNRVGDGE